MEFNTLTKVTPLPKYLEQALLDCYNREQTHIEPVVACTYNTTSELMQRGMNQAKLLLKKKIAVGFYVTQTGKEYLNQL